VGRQVGQVSGVYLVARVRLVTGTELTPGNWEDRGHITHELLHTLGHHHTQNRPDRDQHITVNISNVLDPYQYEKCEDCNVLGTEYDCMSVMHYRSAEVCNSTPRPRWNAMAKNRELPTMVARQAELCDLQSRNR
jgi:hypothetical protein